MVVKIARDVLRDDFACVPHPTGPFEQRVVAYVVFGRAGRLDIEIVGDTEKQKLRC